MKISRSFRPVFMAFCAFTLLLTACKKPLPEFTPERQEALRMLDDTEWQLTPLPEESPSRTLTLYRATGDPNAADEEFGISILSLACAARHLELAEQLLAEGATTQPGKGGFSPLNVLLLSTPEADDEATTIALIDLLLQHGANINQLSENCNCTLTYAVTTPTVTESVFLHLLDKGALFLDDGYSPEEVVFMLASRAWNEALQRAIDMKAPLTSANGANTALHAAALKDEAAETEHAETMRLLLEAGMNPNAVNEEGMSPLFLLLFQLSDEISEDDRECIRLLLEHGATLTEPTYTDESLGEVTALDLLSAHPELIAELREAGFDIPDRPLEIREDGHLTQDLMRAEMRLSGHPQAAEQLKPFLPLLTKVLTQRLYGEVGEAAGAAFSLLCAADKPLAEQVLANLPLWNDTKEWELNQRHLPAGMAIMSAITAQAQEPGRTPLSLPKDKILNLIHLLSERQNDPTLYSETQLQTEVTELLEFAPGAEGDIEQLSKDESRPAVQLGALTAKLHLAGLPDAKTGSAEAWLGDYNPACLPPAVMKVLRLTDLENFWFGEMEAGERAALVADIESLGLYTVADIYRKALPEGLTEEELAAIMEAASEHAVTLELAVARLILEQRKDFEAAKK